MFQETGLDYDEGSAKEWLVTNGLGGYASSTAIGANTRKYHGLLVAARNPPVDRVQLVAKLEEDICIGDDCHSLSVNKYADHIHPEGYYYLSEFTFEDYPVFYYALGDVTVRKAVCMVHGLNATLVNYQIRAKRKGVIDVRPLVNCRSIHGNTHADSTDWQLQRKAHQTGEVMSFYEESPRLLLSADRGSYASEETWYRNLTYDWEAARGYDPAEDLLNAGVFTYPFPEGSSSFTLYFIGGERQESLATIDQRLKAQKGDPFAQEEARRKALVDDFYHWRIRQRRNDLLTTLIKAADQFIVRRKSTKSKTLIAGYPWFTDWGRDTMIAVRGVCLALGRFEDAKIILQQYTHSMRNGLLPNRFTDDGGADYNTVDASLWYVLAVADYHHYTRDRHFIQSIWPKLEEVVNAYVDGTDYGIRMDDDGLVACTDKSQNLTWMDAKTGDTVHTPRNGKPVEIQALWYASLASMEELAESLGKGFSQEGLADRVKESFATQFWNTCENCLYDVVGPDGPDASIRPNQILAISQPYQLLPVEKEKAVVYTVREKLWTPVGLRTLAPDDPRFAACYRGDQASRDAAYHQGTVWPWLLGPYWRSLLKVQDYSPESKHHVYQEIMRLSANLGDHGIGQFSEIFEAETLRPDGCFAQAWSVGEFIRAMSLVI